MDLRHTLDRWNLHRTGITVVSFIKSFSHSNKIIGKSKSKGPKEMIPLEKVHFSTISLL